MVLYYCEILHDITEILIESLSDVILTTPGATRLHQIAIVNFFKKNQARSRNIAVQQAASYWGHI